MSEETFLKLRNEFLKDGHRRRVELWLISFLGVILAAALFILIGAMYDIGHNVAPLRPEILTQLNQSGVTAQTVKAKDAVGAAEIDRLTTLLKSVESERASAEQKSKDAARSETVGWARIGLTTIVGFITGYISGRKNPAGVDPDQPDPENAGSRGSTPPGTSPPPDRAGSGGVALGAQEGVEDDPKDQEDHETDNTTTP